MIIRNYRDEDYEQIAALMSENDTFYEPQYSRENLSTRNPEDFLFLVAEIDGQIIGTEVILAWGKKAAILYGLTVKNEFRRQGVATKLLSEAKKIAQKRGCAQIGMYVNSENKELLNFYSKRGWDKSSKQTWRSLWADIGSENE